MVPAAGIAATADEAVADDELDALFLDNAANFSNGFFETVSYVKADGTTATATPLTADNKTTIADNLKLPYTSSVSYKPTPITLKNGLNNSVTFTNNPDASGNVNEDNYTVSYVKADAQLKPTTTAVAAPSAIGNYCMVVKVNAGTYKGGTCYIPFAIVGTNLSTLKAPDDTTIAVNQFVLQPYDTSVENAGDVNAGGNIGAGTAVNGGTFSYDGEQQTIGFEIAKAASATAYTGTPTKLVEGRDYTIKYAASQSDINAGTSTPPTDAGTYYARLTGIGAYSGTKDVAIDVTPLTLVASGSGAVVNIDDVVGGGSLPTSISSVTLPSGVETTALNGMIDIVPNSYAYTSSGAAAPGDNGAYKCSVVVKEAHEDNFTNGTTPITNVLFTKYGADAKVTYGANLLPATFETNLNDASPATFDPTKIKVYGADNTELAAPTGASTDKYTKNVYSFNTATNDWSTTALTGANLTNFPTTPGKYKVEVAVNPANVTPAYSVGGTQTCIVTVVGNNVNLDASIYVVGSNGNAVTSVSQTYDPDAEIEADNFSVAGKDETGADVDPDAITMTLYNAKGEEVDSATDAGSYTLKLTSTTYNLQGNDVVPITITPADLSDVKLKDRGTVIYTAANKSQYIVSQANSTTPLAATDVLYNTGLKFTPSKKPAYAELGGNITGGEVGDTVNPSSAPVFTSLVKATWSYKDAETGEYVASPDLPAGYVGTAKLVLEAQDPDKAGNFEFDAAGTTYPVVASEQVFADVDPTDWFFGTVNAANAADIAHGWTTDASPNPGSVYYFNPYGALNRADFVCFLYNLAGGDANESAGFDPANPTYKSFSDVADDAYYSKAVAWAKYTGVANGYGDGTFAPTDPLTREQAAAFIANYAQRVAGLDTSVADPEAAIATKSDPGSVSEWAVGTVAWMVENGIMGNGGFINGQGVGNRAEGVTMIMNFKGKFDL